MNVDNLPSKMKEKFMYIAIRELCIAAYLYEKENVETQFSDSEYDSLCKFMLDNWEMVKKCDKNNYIRKGDLETSSGAFIANKLRGLTLLDAKERAILIKKGNKPTLCTVKPIEKKRKKK